MSAHTSIEWTDRTWNVARGCTRVSEGCRNCYAERQAHRFSGPGMPYQGLTKLTKNGPVWTGDVEFVPHLLAVPLSWRKPQRVFVNSMSDLFHEGFTNEQIAAVFAIMGACHRHIFQVLTKRPERMLQWFEWVRAKAPDQEYGLLHDAIGQLAHIVDPGEQDMDDPPSRFDQAMEDLMGVEWPLPNVWLGVSVEDQQRADERIPLLLQCPAAVRFVSAEPLLDDVDLRAWLGLDDGLVDVEKLTPKLDWVIAGGESGPGARPCCLSWLSNIVHDCEEAGVPCFIKQLGAKPYEAGEATGAERTMAERWPVKEWLTLRDRKGGDIGEWPGLYLRTRRFPEVRRG